MLDAHRINPRPVLRVILPVRVRGVAQWKNVPVRCPWVTKGRRSYLHALRNATRSASSWGVSCWSRPAGITETVPGRISSISRRATRTS